MTDRNSFTEKLKDKADNELRQIAGSRAYVEEVRIAATSLLKERGVQVDYYPKKQTGKQKLPWIPGQHLDTEHKRTYEWRMLICGICCLAGVLYLNFESIVTTRRSLTELTGTIKKSEVLVENVSRKGRLGHEDKSRRATLLFSLNEHRKLFKLQENIGQDYSNPEYSRLSRFLTNSKSVSVWVSQSGLNSLEPKVFQIDVDGQTILDYDTVTSEHSMVSALLLFLGLGMTGFALYSKYPERIRKFLGLDEKAANTCL